MLASDWSACVLLLLRYICRFCKGCCSCVCSWSPLQPHLWHLSCSGACPEPRSWPPLCYHANNTRPRREGFLTNLLQDGPRFCGTTATLKAITQPQCSTVTSLHPLRSTQFWRPTSTASRFVAPFLSIIIILFRFKHLSQHQPLLPSPHQAVPCRDSVTCSLFQLLCSIFSEKWEPK